jgi:hypothetical protein
MKGGGETSKKFDDPNMLLFVPKKSLILEILGPIENFIFVKVVLGNFIA